MIITYLKYEFIIYTLELLFKIIYTKKYDRHIKKAVLGRITMHYHDKNVLITGISGFAGSYLAKELISQVPVFMGWCEEGRMVRFPKILWIRESSKN